MTLAARCLREHRTEAPVLPAREALVGRGTDRHPFAEQGLAGPGIVAVRVAAHRQVEPQAKPVLVEPLPQVAELAAGQGLGHEVEALLLGIHLIGVQGAGPRGRRPVPPVPAEPGLRAAEPGVADQLLVQLRRGWNRMPREGGADLGVAPGHVQSGGGGRRAMGLAEVEDQLGPEQPAHRRVRTGLRPLGVEGRHQGEDA